MVVQDAKQYKRMNYYGVHCLGIVKSSISNFIIKEESGRRVCHDL
jgi:hypothetical protein